MASEGGLPRWGGIFDLPKKEQRLTELEHETARSDFWDQPERAQVLLRERAQLAQQVEKIRRLNKSVSDSEDLYELFAEACRTQSSDDEDIRRDCLAELDEIHASLEEMELKRMLSGEHDFSNAILEINAGAGGTEAQDWAEMLLRMYLRWAEKRGFNAEIIQILAGEEAGIKNVTAMIRGESAFGYLRSERGVHRLVRISPFDSNARRHTSFASVAVMPELDDEIKVDIDEDDLRIDTYRSSGAGGQHVNKTDSAVRLTHLPTGVVVACQTDRSQHKNKATAMKLLKAKLYEREVRKKQEQMDEIAGERRKIDFGSQIRSYVLQPYQMIKDLRTGAETSNVNAVLDGDLDSFIRAYLMSEEWNV